MSLQKHIGKSGLVCATLGMLWGSLAFADFPPAWDREQAQKYNWIYDDFDAAVAQSQESGKPMLVVLRCPP